MKPTFHALIFTAEKGTGFKSHRIGASLPLLGKSMLRLVIDSVNRLNPGRIFYLSDYLDEGKNLEPLAAGVEHISDFKTATSVLKREKEADIIILSSDLPLLKTTTLRSLLHFHRREKNDLSLISADQSLNRGKGHILNENELKFLLQHKPFEMPAPVCICRAQLLINNSAVLTGTKSSFSLDLLRGILSPELKVGVYQTHNIEDIFSVKDRLDFSRAVDLMRMRKIDSLSRNGVIFFDPFSTWIDLEVKIATGSTIYPFVILEGNSVIGKNCTLYPGTHLVDSRIGSNVKVLSSTMIESSTIEDDVQVGPFTHLRPNTILRKGAKVGNFVEMKNTDFGAGSKAGHLSYVGDGQVGRNVNIGAGTITCNYDGIKKSRTQIDDGAFIGSGTQLIAPVKIGKKSYIGAGSTITKDVSPESLAVSRVKQTEKKGWARKKRKK